MRLLLILAIVFLIFAGSYKLFYKPAPAVLPPTPVAIPLPDRSADPPPSVLNPEELKKVIETTRDPNPNVRWEAIKFLHKSRAPQADGIILETMTRDTDASVRRNVVVLLGEQKGPTSSRYLVLALQDMEAAVRIAALNSINRIGDYSAAPAISELLQDSDDRVRLAALNTLNALQTKRDDELRRRQQEEERRRQEELRRQQQQQQRR